MTGAGPGGMGCPAGATRSPPVYRRALYTCSAASMMASQVGHAVGSFSHKTREAGEWRLGAPTLSRCPRLATSCFARYVGLSDSAKPSCPSSALYLRALRVLSPAIAARTMSTDRPLPTGV
jgi:hypothetical protein